MSGRSADTRGIPAFGLYGEGQGFPDILHYERIADRAPRHDWQIAPHRHPEMHQFLLLEVGEAAVSIDGETTIMTAPTLLNIPRWTVHGFAFEAGAEGAVLSLPLSELSDDFGTDRALVTHLSRWGMVPATPTLIALMGQIGTHHGTDGVARAPMLRALAMQVACWFAEAMAPTIPSRPTDHLFQEFEDLIRQQFRARWGVGDYAAYLRVSPTHLNRVTRTSAGLSALKLIEAVLFREARRELAYTRQTITQIAHGLGYDDPSYFARAFRLHTGTTPSTYRHALNSAGIQPRLDSNRSPAKAKKTPSVP